MCGERITPLEIKQPGPGLRPGAGSFEWTRRLTSRDSQRSAMSRIARGIDQPGGHKDQQVAFVSHGGLGAEQASDHRNVAEERNFIINLLQLLRDKTAQDDRLTVPNNNAGDQIAGGKQGLLDVVGSSDATQVDGVTVVDESKEICDLGDEGQGDCVTVSSHERGDVEDYADRSSCESRRS